MNEELYLFGSLDCLDQFEVEFDSIQPNSRNSFWLRCMKCSYKWLVRRGFTNHEQMISCPNPEACGEMS